MYFFQFYYAISLLRGSSTGGKVRWVTLSHLRESLKGFLGVQNWPDAATWLMN